MQVLLDKLTHFKDSLLCRVCLSEEMQTAFQPCGHVVCCSSCAPLVDSCPLCRGSIDVTQKIFLPVRATSPVEESLSSDLERPRYDSTSSDVAQTMDMAELDEEISVPMEFTVS